MSDQADRDPIQELVRALRPERQDGLPVDGFLASSTDPVADALLNRVVSVPVRRRRWPWRRTTIFVVAISTLIGAGVTTALLLTREPDDPTVVVCRSSIETDADLYLLTAEPDISPVELCRPLWSDGRLGTTGAPPLIACAPADTGIVVVPGDQAACAVQGWQVAATDPTGVVRDSELTSELSSTFTGRCFDRFEAEVQARTILERLELSDWSVEMSGFAEDRCNAPAPDFTTKRILFAPI